MWDRTAETVKAAWKGAVTSTARAYDLKLKVLGSTAPGGRGPRTPPPYWFPRKVAIYVAIDAVDCTYAALAREIGMHRDTVASQCGEVRERVEADRVFARLVDTLVEKTRLRAKSRLDVAAAQQLADLDHLDDLMQADDLGVSPPRRSPRGRGNPTIVRQKTKRFERAHENLIPFLLDPAE